MAYTCLPFRSASDNLQRTTHATTSDGTNPSAFSSKVWHKPVFDSILEESASLKISGVVKMLLAPTNAVSHKLFFR